MAVQNVRLWQWMLIGAAVGMLFAVVKVYQGPWYDNADVDTLDQARFERELVSIPELAPWRRSRVYIEQFHKDQPLIKNIEVHPPQTDAGPSWWVTGKTYSIVTEHKDPANAKSPMVLREQWVPFKYPAKAPYRATTLYAGTYPTVLDYLKTVRQKSPKAQPFVNAWWTAPALPYLLLPVAGVLLLGLAWPALLALLQHAGLAPRRIRRVKLAPNRTIAGPARPAVDMAAASAQLDELNSNFEASLDGFGTGSDTAAANDDSAAGVAGPRPAVLLNGVSSAVDGPAPDRTEPEKDYGGEFYPVARPAVPPK